MANEQQPKPSGKNSIVLIAIIVIVFFLIILGVGSYFGWKYYKQLVISATTTPTPSASVSATPTVMITATPIAGTTSGTGLKSGEVPINGYMIYDSDSRTIIKAEIRNFTPWQLKIARNEIYARHGRPFVHKDLQCYFSGQSWYQINPYFDESVLTVIETKNIKTIKDFEDKTNSPLASHDSGC